MLQQHCHFRWMVRDAFSPELSQIPLKFAVFSWNSKIRIDIFKIQGLLTLCILLYPSYEYDLEHPGALTKPNILSFRQNSDFQGNLRNMNSHLWLWNFNIIFTFWDNIWSALTKFLSDVFSMVSHTKHELQSTSVGLSEKDNFLVNH